MNLDLPIPGRVRVISPEVGPTEKLALDGVSVEVGSYPDAWSSEAVERLTAGRVDYVLIARTGRLPSDHVAGQALAVLRSDPSTAAVGPTLTDASSGALELAVSGRWMLVRADALRALARWVDLTTSAGVVDLCVRLWCTGHRVRSLQDPAFSAPEEEAVVDEVRRSMMPLDVDEPAFENLRRRHGVELVPLARRWLAEWSEAGGPQLPTDLVRRHRNRLLVVTADVLAPAMAGPAIRAVAIATALAPEHDVRLVSTARCSLELDGLTASFVDERGLRAEIEWADVIILQGWVMSGRPWLRDSTKVVVVDLYDPMHLEQLEQGRDAEGELGRSTAVRRATATLNEQMGRADFALCASSHQRHLWLGALASLGRVNPATYDDHPSLESLLAIVPFGVPDQPIGTVQGAIKGVVPGIGVDDPVVLWGGGVYNWFDPLTLVRAIDRLRGRVPSVRLYFLGLTHPNPAVPAMRVATELRRLSDELGLTDLHVFFNEGWVDYDRRASYLIDADVAVTTHLHHLETEFSFRTRILDYLWAGLPIVSTDGDGFADLLRDTGAGLVVPEQDVGALEGALGTLLLDPAAAAACREQSRALAAGLTWSRNLEPLLEFCRSPRRAPDLACPTFDVAPRAGEPARGLRRDLSAAAAYLRAGGPGELFKRTAARVPVAVKVTRHPR